MCEQEFLDGTGQPERYQMERLAETGVTGERGRVCEVYFEKKALVMEPRGKGWCGSGEKMKCLKVDKRTFLLCVCVCVCALQEQVAKGSWGDSSRLEESSASLSGAQHHGGTAGTAGLAGCLCPQISTVPGGDVSVKGKPCGLQQHREVSEGTVVRRLSFDR